MTAPARQYSRNSTSTTVMVLRRRFDGAASRSMMATLLCDLRLTLLPMLSAATQSFVRC